MRKFLDNKKPFKYDADVIVIGSGAGGGVAVHTLAQHGVRVILIEESKLGGECANYSCIPTKALLETVNSLNIIKISSKYGLKTSKAEIDFAGVKHWVKKAVNNTGVNNKGGFESNNVKVVQGHAHFISPYTVSVGLKRLSAKKFIIATGAGINIPDSIAGINESKFITYKDIMDLKEVPESIAIVGGGSVGYEYAQIFSGLGSKVHLFESKGHILPDCDTEVGDLTESILSSQGVRVHTSSKVNAIKKLVKSVIIEHKNHGQNHKISVEKIMLATGYSPNSDIGLENANVSYTEEGVKVNSKMQTSQKHIFAIGDVTGTNNNASSALKQGQIAAHNILHRKKHTFNGRATPHVTFGYPEVATVGQTERQLKLTAKPFQTSVAPIGIVGRAYSADYQAGFVKIVASHTGTVLGASIVAPHAGELISELSVAIDHYRKACDISNTIHPFSTWSEAVKVAASKIYCF